MGRSSIPDQSVGFVVQKLQRDKIFSNYIRFPVSNIPPAFRNHISFTTHRHYTNLASEGIVKQNPPPPLSSTLRFSDEPQTLSFIRVHISSLCTGTVHCALISKPRRGKISLYLGAISKVQEPEISFFCWFTLQHVATLNLVLLLLLVLCLQ